MKLEIVAIYDAGFLDLQSPMQVFRFPSQNPHQFAAMIRHCL